MELRLDKHRAFFNNQLPDYQQQLNSMEGMLQQIRDAEPTNVGVNLAAVEAPYTSIAARFEVSLLSLLMLLLWLLFLCLL